MDDLGLHFLVLSQGDPHLRKVLRGARMDLLIQIEYLRFGGAMILQFVVIIINTLIIYTLIYLNQDNKPTTGRVHLHFNFNHSATWFSIFSCKQDFPPARRS